MEGLLSHYYLLKSDPETGVRRHITITTPHQGSTLANWMLWYNNVGIAGQIVDGMRAFFHTPILSTVGRILTPLPFVPTYGFYAYGNAGGEESNTL